MPSTKRPDGYLGLMTKIAVGVLALTFIGDRSEALQTLDFSQGELGANLVVVFVFWLNLLGPGFYLVALWILGSVFDRLDAWDSFAPELVKGLRGTGENLVIGAVCATLVSPTLIIWLTEGFRGARWHVGIENIVLGLTGVALYLLARAGRQLRSELEQIV